MLLYTAELKNPVSEPLSAKRARVAAVVEQLSLSGCAGIRIGSALHRGISGGSIPPGSGFYRPVLCNFAALLLAFGH